MEQKTSSGTSAEAHNDGGPAFPQAEYPHMGQSGMTLRDYFAAKAMAALIAAPLSEWPEFTSTSSVSCAAYELADAMLAARGGAQ